MKKILPILLLLTALFVPASVAFAQAEPFAYITIKGPGITGDLSATSSTLVAFPAFADFTQGTVEPPTNPGEEFEIVRTYIDGENKARDFDKLYYYPDTGFVYYVGVYDGASDLAENWYIANPAIEADFRAVLAERARLTWIPFAAFIAGLVVFAVAYFRKKPNQ